MFIHVVTKHLRDRVVVTFNLPVRLGMIRRRVKISYPQDAAHALEELRVKLRTVVR